MLTRKTLVLAKAQAGIGIAAVPTPADNAIQVRSAKPSLITAEWVQRNLMRGYKGNYGSLITGEHRVLEFETEFGPTGAAGDPTPLSPLFLTSGFTETLNAGVSAVYGLTSLDTPYCTLYCYQDKVLFKLEDAWGTVSAELNPKGIPVLKWRYIGKYVALVDENVPTNGDFTAFIKPKTVSKANTPTFTVHGHAVKASAFGWDVANDLKWRELINESGVTSIDRKPTARCTFELTSVAAKNWATTILANTEAAIQMIHGAGAGQIVQLDMPKAQFMADPSIEDGEGHLMLAGQFSLNPNAGDDELVITFK
jgi:hypothetical protein